ncbi:hypothetical protein [Leuconostoc mesenteroides]|uniref:hypothetical protein n=1 Tax=Leuconostoc mesenteroides TaxID=1245 RepID=UPI00386CEE21
MSEDTKKPLNGSLATEVQETQNNFIKSDYIIKSHDLVNSRSSSSLADKEMNTIFRSVYEREKRRLLGGQ